jgi:hypothetical protein
MLHWPLVQADLMQFYGVRDDQARQYQGPWFVNLVWQLFTDPATRVLRLWQSERNDQ